MGLIGNVAAGLFLVVGAGFCLIAAIGLIRLPDVYTRMHAASKAGTLGSCLLLIVAGLHSLEAPVAARALAGFTFFLLTAPVSAHLIARAALYRGYKPARITWINEIEAREPEFRQGLPPNVQTSAENQSGSAPANSLE